MAAPTPLILTLALDARSLAFFDALRRRHFPAGLNHIPAHLTLFHALPGNEIETIDRDLVALAAARPAFRLDVTGPRLLGRGVAYRLASADLARLRADLASRWSTWLGPQDRHPHSLHVTVQNKVEPAEARALLETLQATFTPFAACGEGLDLWWYRGGPWEQARRFPFRP